MAFKNLIIIHYQIEEIFITVYLLGFAKLFWGSVIKNVLNSICYVFNQKFKLIFYDNSTKETN